MELYILSKQDLSILSIGKLTDYQINLDEETNSKSTFTLMKTEGLKKDNFIVLNGLYRQFLFVIDEVTIEKGSDTVMVTALDISNIFDRKVIEKNTDTMNTNSIEEFIANTMSENFVNSDDTALDIPYIDIKWKTSTKTSVATNAENGLYNFHTFLTNCRQYKNIYTDFKIEEKRPSKNKLLYDAEDTTINGITFTRNADGSVSVKGTSTDIVNYELSTKYTTVDKEGTYILSGCPVGGGSTDDIMSVKYMLMYYGFSQGEFYPYGIDFGEGVAIPITTTDEFVGLINIQPGVTLDATFYPMLRLEGTDDTFEEYEDVQNSIGSKLMLNIEIENKEEEIKLIDTTLPEVTDYNKIYEEDVTAKVQVYIREDGSEYNLYLKTDKTTTTNKDDPDRASGKIEVISVETADMAAEEALNVMKGNNYKHLVEFKIAKTSKLMDITKLHIGRPILIKTDDDIYESYISAITLNDENFVYFKSGSLRITLLDKLKKNANNTGNKLDVSGGKIKGNLSIDGNFEVNGVNIVGGVSGDTLPIGSVMEWDSDTIPVNWLLLNGQAVSRTEYNELFKLYGTRYGEGDGSTTFNLPNRKTRVSVGKDSTDTDFNTLGKIGGEKTHKLTVSEMPAHNHGMTWNTGSDSSASAASWVSATATQVVNTKKTGGDGAHNNLQPYFVTNFIVKAKQNPGVVATVIDNLESISEIDALSAKQGKVLNDSKLDTSSNLTNTEIETLINNIIL